MTREESASKKFAATIPELSEEIKSTQKSISEIKTAQVRIENLLLKLSGERGL